MRDRTEVEGLLRDVEALYGLGGPPVAQGPNTNWDPCEAHGYILASLDDPGTAEGGHYERVLADCHLDNLAGLRALLRLTGANAAMAVLRWVLDDESVPSAFSSEQPSRSQCLEEVASAPWWGRAHP